MRTIKILVISNIEWSDQNAFGNTISNWFKGLSNIDFSNLYRRSGLPCNEVCFHYYSITSISILKHFFDREKIGKEFSGNYKQSYSRNNLAKTNENRIIEFVHRHNAKVVYLIDELLFGTLKWNNKKFKRYIKNVNPDIIFSFLTGSPQLIAICNAVKEIVPTCREVYHIADDVYSESSLRGKENIRKLINRADVLYGASQMLCQVYSNMFGRSVKPLYKGCRCFSDIKHDANKDSRSFEIVYAGNLRYGRDKTLKKVIGKIREYNISHDSKFHLSIYSSSSIDDSLRPYFDDGVASSFLGEKPFEEIKLLLNKADLVIHVESFEDQWKKIVRYSYSTKIIDCLESGSAFWVVGPDDISSVVEASQIPGVFVAVNEEQISETLEIISSDELENRAKTIRKYAIDNCRIEAVQQMLYSDMMALLHQDNQADV